MKASYTLTLTALCATTLASGQGFINLDFEDAVVQRLPGNDYQVLWSLAVPGWGSGQAYVYYGQGHVGFPPLYLLMDSTSPVLAPGTQLAGNYSLSFSSGFAGHEPMGAWSYAFINQIGLVPSSSRSIRMLATGPFKVLVGQIEIPMISLGGNSYGGDVSQFAGHIADLTIVNDAPYGYLGDATVLDNVEFSPDAIPEPSTLTLLGLGAWTLTLCLIRR